MATTPQFAGTVNRSGAALSTTADVAVATAGALITPTASSFVTLWTAGASGGKVEEISLVQTGTTTLAIVRIYIYNTTNYQLYDLIPSIAYTNSTTAPSVPVRTTYSNLVLDANETIVGSCTVAAQPINVIVLGGSF